MAEKKIYDYKVDAVKSKIVSALRKRKLEATVTDLVATTGLPNYQVQQSMNSVADEYRGQMRVTESGEILYYFPEGFRSRYRGFAPTFKRVFKSVLRGTGKVLSLLFKIWIVAMLVGYFVIFVGLLLLAMLASVAGSAASNSSNRSRGRDGLGFGGFFIVTRVVQIFIELWLYSSLTRGPNKQRKRGRPLHKSVFSYVFGEGDPNPEWATVQKRAIIKYIQGNKGVITLEEVMSLTGDDHNGAQDLMNQYLAEFEGEPEVTSDGTLYYRFNDLMKSRDIPSDSLVRSAPIQALYPFSANKPSTNRWLTFFNAFNLLFGSYFLYFGMFVPIIPRGSGFGQFYLMTSTLLSRYLGLDPTVFLPVVLGAVPFVFSILFFLIPLVRRGREKAANQTIKQNNFRRRLVDRILQNPLYVDPMKIQPVGVEESPDRWESFRESSLKQFAAVKGADIEDIGEGNYLYKFNEVDREQKDIARLRSSIDVKEFDIGSTIYDSGEPPT
ncbi:MAG TPA: hypothetical protein VMW69_05270 [Spirochaetia bacterium]|nr:hypothetical protein [Spirochaetia bacterium]